MIWPPEPLPLSAPFLHAVLAYGAPTLLSLGFASEMLYHTERHRLPFMSTLSFPLLALGTAAALAGAFLGLAIPHPRGPAQALVGPWGEHRFLGLWNTAYFLALTVWCTFARRRPGPLLAIAWAAGIWVSWLVVGSGRRLSGPLGY